MARYGHCEVREDHGEPHRSVAQQMPISRAVTTLCNAQDRRARAMVCRVFVPCSAAGTRNCSRVRLCSHSANNIAVDVTNHISGITAISATRDHRRRRETVRRAARHRAPREEPRLCISGAEPRAQAKAACASRGCTPNEEISRPCGVIRCAHQARARAAARACSKQLREAGRAIAIPVDREHQQARSSASDAGHSRESLVAAIREVCVFFGGPEPIADARCRSASARFAGQPRTKTRTVSARTSRCVAKSARRGTVHCR